MLKKFFILLFLIPLYCFSQDTASSKSKYSIGFFFAPCYSYRTIIYEPSQVEIYNERNKRDMPAFGYSTGFVIQKCMHKKLNMSYGIMFTQFSFNVKKSILNYGSQIDNFYDIGYLGGIYPPLNPADSLMPVYYSKTNNYFYLRMPISLNYDIKISQQHFFSSLSFMPIDIFIVNKNYFTFYYKDGSLFKVKDPSFDASVEEAKNNLSLAFSFAFLTDVFDNNKLSISIFFNKQLFSYFSDRGRFFQIGLSNCIIF